MKTEKRIFISFMLNFIFTIFEFIGGILTNSVALLSDSVHDLGDSISMGIAIFLEKKAKQKPDYTYTYGYYRFSLLGALISATILLIGSIFIIVEAIKRLISPEVIDAELVIWFAVFGVLVNGLAAVNAAKGKSINEKVISLHLFEDVFGWGALLITAIVVRFTDFYALDAILSIGFTVFIGFHVFKNIKKVLQIFLEKTPKGYSIETLTKKLSSVKHVKNIHHVHLWSVDGSTPLITLHAELDDKLKTIQVSEVQNNLKQLLADEGILHTTIQVEFSGTICPEEPCEEDENKPQDKHKHSY